MLDLQSGADDSSAPLSRSMDSFYLPRGADEKITENISYRLKSFDFGYTKFDAERAAVNADAHSRQSICRVLRSRCNCAESLRQSDRGSGTASLSLCTPMLGWGLNGKRSLRLPQGARMLAIGRT